MVAVLSKALMNAYGSSARIIFFTLTMGWTARPVEVAVVPLAAVLAAIGIPKTLVNCSHSFVLARAWVAIS